MARNFAHVGSWDVRLTKDPVGWIAYPCVRADDAATAIKIAGNFNGFSTRDMYATQPKDRALVEGRLGERDSQEY